MKIPTPATYYKMGVAIALAVAGCASSAAVAPFPSRPDTVVPGDLAGPFDGRVLDADSGKPVEAATVLGSWAFDTGSGMAGPAAAVSRVVETDADGRYRLPRLVAPASARGRLARFTLVIYRRGFIGYRSDRRWDDFSARHDFAQSGNVARLERVRPDTSHGRHLRYLGAGGPLLAKLGWEIQQAGIDAAPRPEGEKPSDAKAAAEEPLLDAGVLLTAEELQAVTGWKGTFGIEKLGDLPTTAQYDSVHFRATGKGESFDAALRVFRLDAATAERQFGVLAKELPGAVEKNEVGDRSIRSREGQIYAVATLVRAHGAVLVFTCGADQCHDFDTTVALVRRMVARLDRLGRASEATP